MEPKDQLEVRSLLFLERVHDKNIILWYNIFGWRWNIMKNFRIKVASLFAILALSITMVVFAAGVIDHSAVLNGKVAAQGLVKVNDTVQEGQVLVSVETLTGVAPTSRAKVTGVVTEVLVTPGQSVKTGQIVVKVESQNP